MRPRSSVPGITHLYPHPPPPLLSGSPVKRGSFRILTVVTRHGCVLHPRENPLWREGGKGVLQPTHPMRRPLPPPRPPDGRPGDRHSPPGHPTLGSSLRWREGDALFPVRRSKGGAGKRTHYWGLTNVTRDWRPIHLLFPGERLSLDPTPTPYVGDLSDK